MPKPGRPKSFDETAALDAALGVFWAKGFEAAGIQELTDAMGIGRQSLYNAFGDKCGLYRRAIEHYGQKVTAPLLAILCSDEEPKVVLCRLLDEWEQMMTAPACRGCVLVNSAMDAAGSTDPDLAEVLARQKRGLFEALEHLIERGQRAGQFTTAASAQDLAAMVAVLGGGAASYGRGGGHPEAVRGALQGARALLMSDS